MQISEEAVLLARVQFDGAEDVGELKAVDDYACFVGEGSGLDDVHAPGCQRACHISKKAVAIAHDHGEIEELSMRAKVELDWILVQFGGQLKVIADVLRGDAFAGSVGAGLRGIV